MRWRQKPGRAVACYHDGMTAVFASPPEPGTKPKYPFAEWLDGREWTLMRGRDFWGDFDTIERQIAGSANSRRLRYKMWRTEDRRGLVVKALGPRLPKGAPDGEADA